MKLQGVKVDSEQLSETEETAENFDVCSQSATNCGLTICYAIAICKNSKLTSLDLKAKHEEIGAVEKWHKKYSHESFAASFYGIKDFLDIYDNDDFGRWTFNIVYQNIEVIINCNYFKTKKLLLKKTNRRVSKNAKTNVKTTTDSNSDQCDFERNSKPTTKTEDTTNG